jgi:hypothetical protein
LRQAAFFLATPSSMTQNGAILEIGSALGAGKTVYLVTEHEWGWQYPPRVRRFVSLEHAITSILAAMEG